MSPLATELIFAHFCVPPPADLRAICEKTAYNSNSRCFPGHTVLEILGKVETTRYIYLAAGQTHREGSLLNDHATTTDEQECKTETEIN